MPTTTDHSSATPPAGEAAGGLPAEDRSSRRWIRRRIEKLDPYKDYAEIVRLNSVFQVNDFVGDWVAAQSMPRFATTPSAPAIYRGGKGKLVLTSGRRLQDTGNHALVWMEFGPDAPQTRHSIEMINALHAKYAAQYPDAFDDPELWVYVMAWEICGVPALLTRTLGLPEPDEKSKIATVLFGKRIAELFVTIDGRPLTETLPPLDTYEDWVGFLHTYESRTWPYSDEAAGCAEAVLGHFETWFPRPLRPFGRALVTTFWYDGMLAGGGVKPPGRFMRWTARTFMKTLLSLGALTPDPKESWAEKQRRLNAETGAPLTHVLKVTQGATGVAGTGRCPVNTAQGDVAQRPDPAPSPHRE